MTIRTLTRPGLLALLGAAGFAAGCSADRVATDNTAEAQVTAKAEACGGETKSSCCSGKSDVSAKAAMSAPAAKN